MSFLYDPRSKRPQIWTYPVFIGITLAVFFGIYSYGQKKSNDRVKETVSTEVEQKF